MPIYEYRCENCGRQFEIIQKFSDSPLETCTSCQGRLSKLISPTAFQFKGAGWYVTDYARKSEPKSESKPDAKTESKDSNKEKSTVETAPKTGTSAAPEK
jgi:putative FmdB family regulatory protein